jgi:hypothetical protein
MRAIRYCKESPTVLENGLERHLNEFEVENVTGTPVSTLRYWRVIHKGPPYRRIGRRVVYPEKLLKSWIEALPMGGQIA